eukprot:COSAG06_NODE_11350_length_1523_cov_1.421348_1_plen_265_part_00
MALLSRGRRLATVTGVTGDAPRPWRSLSLGFRLCPAHCPPSPRCGGVNPVASSHGAWSYAAAAAAGVDGPNLSTNGTPSWAHPAPAFPLAPAPAVVGAGAPAPPLKSDDDRIFRATDYGAVDDGETNSTAAFSACLAALVSAGGGKMVLPHTKLGIYRGNIVIPPSNAYISIEITGDVRPMPLVGSVGKYCLCGINSTSCPRPRYRPRGSSRAKINEPRELDRNRGQSADSLIPLALTARGSCRRAAMRRCACGTLRRARASSR